MARLARVVAVAAAFAAAMLAAPRPGVAQPAPDDDWRTLRTAHFDVHFTPELEPLARRAAANAERAWTQLAAELPPPRGRIQLVVTDHVDAANGSATTFPSNRIVIHAQPPVDVATLRFYDDWNALVVTHELAHLFHLDQSRGWWRAAQRVFGRSPLLFPNQYLPAWVTEGLAVYYESRLTGSGRIVGTQHRTYARAAALEQALSRPGDWSLGTSRFPGGEVAYAYGGLFIDWLARTRGPETVGEFVAEVAGAPLPFLLERRARRGFGVSFGDAWSEWRDSLDAGTAHEEPAMAGTRRLAGGLWSAEGPRWLDDARLVVGANTGREVPGAYMVDTAGRWRRLGRRNVATPNEPLADGALLYAQPDYGDPYRLRSDLYVAGNGGERRLTRGARLTRPDARPDGAIVAVQTLPGTTRLVRVSPDGRTITALGAASPDTQWTEPRWSPDGTRLVAVRRAAGGVSAVVLLDTLGRPLRDLASARAVHANPSWSPDGRTVLYAADSSGRSELYEVAVEGGAPERLSATRTGLFHPERSPDATRLAAVRYAAAGHEIVAVAPQRLVAGSSGQGGGTDTLPPAAAAAPATLPVLEGVDAPARRYSPWRTLRPTYWLPLLQTHTDGDLMLGAATSGRDVVGRHRYALQGLASTETGLREYALGYGYAGFGRPVLDVGFVQGWRRFAVEGADGGAELRRRTRTASLGATWSRPRVRSSAYVGAGAEVEWRDYVTSPAAVLDRLDPFYRTRPTTPAVQLSAGVSNTQRPLLSISAEDGVSLSATVRQRWLDAGTAPQTRSAVGVATAYRSIPWLPGFAHHVLALRVAGGWADDAATTEWEVGGVSGGTLEVLPGVVLGEGARTFGVRGVAPGTQWGTRAAAATLEWRAPIAVGGRGLLALPVFFDRASVAAFVDAGSAWCAADATAQPVCRGARHAPRWLTSAGAELDLDVALQYDAPYRFRLGVAVPRADDLIGIERTARAYVAVGRAF